MDNLFGSGRLLFATLPANTVLPTISGTTAVGDTLTATDGTWSGVPAPTFTYQWRTCDPAGLNCIDLPGQVASTHVITSNDRGHTLRIVVTGTNTAGFSTATSTETGIPGPPVNVTSPTISGTTQTGSTLTANTGTWLGRAHADVQPTSGSAVARPARAASTSQLTAFRPTCPVVADLGMTLRVKVTCGTNGIGGRRPAESRQTAVITLRRPITAVAVAVEVAVAEATTSSPR